MESSTTTSKVVKAGVIRLCNDFDSLIAPFGFVRSRKGSRLWKRENDGWIDKIHFERSGSSYGAPRNNSVDIRVYYSVQSIQTADRGETLTSDTLRDSRGYAYHLRFNALSWSTYDRCLEDLVRITNEHGLPWFAQCRAFKNLGQIQE